MANADIATVLQAIQVLEENQVILSSSLAYALRKLNQNELDEKKRRETRALGPAPDPLEPTPIWKTNKSAGLSYDSNLAPSLPFRVPSFRRFDTPELQDIPLPKEPTNPDELRVHFSRPNSSSSSTRSVTTTYSAGERPLLPVQEKDTGEDEIQLNGGFTAWSQVFVSFLLVFNGFGYFSSFGLFQSHWTETLHATPSEIAWVGSMMLFLLFFLGILSGPLMDKGHFRSLIVVGCCFQILGAFSTSGVTQYWQLMLAQGIVQGIGNGMLFTPCVALVSIYFTKRRAFALSISACGAPFGGIVFPLVRYSSPASRTPDSLLTVNR